MPITPAVSAHRMLRILFCIKSTGGANHPSSFSQSGCCEYCSASKALGAPITPAVSANQNIANTVLHQITPVVSANQNAANTVLHQKHWGRQSSQQFQPIRTSQILFCIKSPQQFQPIRMLQTVLHQKHWGRQSSQQFQPIRTSQILFCIKSTGGANHPSSFSQSERRKYCPASKAL